MRRRTLLASALLAPAARAQGWPDRPLTILVPYGTGGASDLVARVLATRMQPALGKPVVAENRPGGNGEVASRLLARAAPDGHSFMVGASGIFVINPALRPTLGYDPLRDFSLITTAVSAPNVLVVNPEAVPATTLEGVLAWLRANPGRASYSTSGIGSSHHLTMELFKQLTGTEAVHVPYAGGGAAVTDLIAGTVQLAFLDLGIVIGAIRGGRLRPIIVSSEARSPVLPEVPTAAEAGLPGFVATSWQGVAAPAGLPEPLLARLHAEVSAALRHPETAERLAQTGLTLVLDSPAEFRARVQAELARWRQVVQRAGISVE